MGETLRPSRAWRSRPLLVLSANLARSYLASWSRIPSVSFPLGGFVAPVVEGPEPATVLGELLAQEVVVRRLPGDPVPVLGQHHRHAAGRDEVPDAVHAGAGEASPAVARIQNLRENRVALPRRVLAQGFHLLG
jgi:hypothetical protein